MRWTKRYHDSNPKNKCFGGKVIIKLKNGSKIEREISVADAHPSGKRPFKREQYIEKFKNLTSGLITSSESNRFLDTVQNLTKLRSSDLKMLNIEVKARIKARKNLKKSIF